MAKHVLKKHEKTYFLFFRGTDSFFFFCINSVNAIPPAQLPVQEVGVQMQRQNTNGGCLDESVSTRTGLLGQQQQQPYLSSLLLPLALMLQQQNNRNSLQKR
jgi:hypothetical protein